MIQEQHCSDAGRAIIFDAEMLATPTAAMFTGAYWQQKVVGRAPGRGHALFIDDGTRHWVLRHYRRGGLPGKLFHDQYLFTGLDNSRAFREWRVLAAAFADGVPVPRPVAAAVRRRGLVYTADIILERITDAVSLADWLADGEMPADYWHSLAEAIASCHQAGYWHADLNARNLICRRGEWWLVDFDRARKRAGGRWQQANLSRLRRSLDKLQAAGELEFAEADWQRFLSAYQERMCDTAC